ncbi:MGMT family protein [Colwellia sp. MSW7]|jgi:methylated-DNA-protein-cysteine methyltransferase-like protein|uniref:MGMT family protein n=1 Tax=Colwellia maritima TaxID=2912588 RepID=A0ABS9WZS1_9GAMM|nr:MGMT family protein [Colwellia maritima]MCI2283459.1 MGMT family protein [Colwellia maritima]
MTSQEINPKYIQIWETVQKIPEGKVACYGQIADLAGLPGKARLVGKALGKVPKSGWQKKAVPWYRVINAQGKISFSFDNSHFKKQTQFLQDEQVAVIAGKINLVEFQWQPNMTELLFTLKY